MVLSLIVLGLTCLVGCSTSAGQRVLSAASVSLLQSGHHLRLIAGGVLKQDQACSQCLGVLFPMSPCTLYPVFLLPDPDLC
ncbi:unnamed protein product [Staurois parvus]|uniref:Lipoprotein n=1 Tax=Staurois parvus TaxID=386267 RepID=A0ABN9GG19_9NEOB|nr:unnamed protein product [Staurois parvus]